MPYDSELIVGLTGERIVSLVVVGGVVGVAAADAREMESARAVESREIESRRICSMRAIESARAVESRVIESLRIVLIVSRRVVESVRIVVESWRMVDESRVVVRERVVAGVVTSPLASFVTRTRRCEVVVRRVVSDIVRRVESVVVRRVVSAWADRLVLPKASATATALVNENRRFIIPPHTAAHSCLAPWAIGGRGIHLLVAKWGGWRSAVPCRRRRRPERLGRPLHRGVRRHSPCRGVGERRDLTRLLPNANTRLWHGVWSQNDSAASTAVRSVEAA